MTLSHPLLHRLSTRVARGTSEPLSRLIVDDVWLAVVEGTLETGERLPTARQVAVALGVSPRAVERAYRELEERGVVATRPGEGTFISLALPPEEERERHRRFAELCHRSFEEARELGFGVDELIDALAEFRDLERERPDRTTPT